MDLELSEDEAALRDNVRTVLAGICPSAVVRSAYEGGDPRPTVWRQMVELGWPALTIAEEHGGLGLGFVEQVLVAEELGRAVVPSPLLATATQFTPAIQALGGPASEATLAAVAAGELTGALALAEDGRWDPATVRASARREGDGWVLDGAKRAVLDGATADRIVVIARGADGLGAFVLERGAARAEARTVLDPTMPVADLHLEGVVVGPEGVLARPGEPDVERRLHRCVEQAVVAVAAMTVGACRRLFEETIEYAKTREQYDRPIGSFQALKHRMADMYLSVERATALVYFAALTSAEDAPERSLAAAAAKSAAGDCQQLVVQEGLQLHGGIGYTWEHDLHFLLKRAKAGDALFGNAVVHRAGLADLLGLDVEDGSEAVA
jgi:alkylation response protein AidB-like acyl-CoA dehydrogenase